MYGAKLMMEKRITAYIVYTVPVTGKTVWQIWSGLYNLTIEILRALIIKLTQARVRAMARARVSSRDRARDRAWERVYI